MSSSTEWPCVPGCAVGRVEVSLRPSARLLDDLPLEHWIDRLRDACRDKERTPERYQAFLRQIDRAMFTFANRSEHGSGTKFLVDVLCALGQAERTLANGLSFCARIHPTIAGARFAVARPGGRRQRGVPSRRQPCGNPSDSEKEVGPLRVFIVPVEVNKFVNWLAGSTSAVWSKQPLADNLAAAFRRRQMEAFRKGFVGVPLYSSRSSLDDVLVFLREEIDDATRTTYSGD